MGHTLSMSQKPLIALLLLSLSASSLGFSQIKEYLDMWNWETECWGEANVAQFHQFEEQLVNQCLQTPVNEEIKKMAPKSAPLARLTQQPMAHGQVHEVHGGEGQVRGGAGLLHDPYARQDDR